MDIAELKELEAKATPGPWRGRELTFFGQGQATGPAHEITENMKEPYPWYYDAALISKLRNLAPELIALWDAVNQQQASCHSTTIRKAIDALNEKAWSMVI